MNCPWCQQQLKEDAGDYDGIYICYCVENEFNLPTCQAAIVDNILYDFMLWIPNEELCITKTNTLWCVSWGHLKNNVIAKGKSDSLTLDEAAVILKRFSKLKVFL